MKPKDQEYYKKILKLGALKLEEGKEHRKAIIKKLAPLRLSEKKEILREMDKFFLEAINDDNKDCTVANRYRSCTEKKIPPRKNSMIVHYDWFYLSLCRDFVDDEIKYRQEEKMKRLNERRKRMIKLVRINNKWKKKKDI